MYKIEDPSQIYVIIPCFNEAQVLRQTILPLVKCQYQVVIVDDGSTDNSWRTIQDLPVFYLKHLTNLGQGAALQTGMDFVLKEGGNIAIHFDADGQHPPEEITNLIKPILEENYDIVIGSRFLKKENKNQIPRKKIIVLKLARYFNGLMTGVWLTDAHNGFRALNRNALEKIRFSENGMAHATEILSLIKKQNLILKEIPVNINYTAYSIQKGQSIWNALNILFDLLKKRWL